MEKVPLKQRIKAIDTLLMFIWFLCCEWLSPREHTIAGINQNHITHTGDIQEPVVTHLGTQLNIQWKPRLATGVIDFNT